MNRRLVFPAFVAMALLGTALLGTLGRAYLLVAPGEAMTEAANQFLEKLAGDERKIAQLEYDTPKRVDWHFIPKDQRKGLQIKEMNEGQRAAALALLKSALSAIGNEKATKIMTLEILLRELQAKKGKGGPLRDPERYYFTVFGQPQGTGRWGLSVEGHHLSLNFVVENNRVISSTPTVFAANPATVMNEVPGTQPKGTRLLAKEEQRAFDLIESLDEKQLETAIVAAKAPGEIRAAGEPQPPQEPPVGIQAAALTDAQRQTLTRLIEAYSENLPAEVAQERWAAIRSSGLEKVHFAWAGATKPGIGHYYRVQGPTFLIEFVNTQTDAAGNVANHIHSIWRDMRGDFAIPVQ